MGISNGPGWVVLPVESADEKKVVYFKSDFDRQLEEKALLGWVVRRLGLFTLLGASLCRGRGGCSVGDIEAEEGLCNGSPIKRLGHVWKGSACLVLSGIWGSDTVKQRGRFWKLGLVVALSGNDWTEAVTLCRT